MTARLRAPRAPISYSIPEAAEASGLSETTVKEAIASGRLEKHYPTPTKPVILADDLIAWIRDSPVEREA